ncbi:MAG: ATP synthase F1 subunit delta [Candidatus Saccharicenans sp.]|uniref:ATP synthase F1 subunit delta n=1 Tax=Candidatus Saccharicenans sp. TaxID=2819258 RepID=UPI00404A8EB7
MNRLLIVRKYARGLARAMEQEAEFELCLEQIKALVDLMSSNAVIQTSLASAFIPGQQKKKVVEEILKQGDFNPKVGRLLWLLVENEKIALLPDILEALPVVWAEDRGIEICEVNSAVDLTEEEKARLQTTLEKKWRRPVRLNYRINREIIGGLVLKKGNIYYDVSVRGGLLKLKEIVSQR